MSRISMLIAVCALALLLAAVPASAEPPQATAAVKCSVAGKWRKLGASYVNKLAARGVTCADARSFSKLYHACRHRNGGKRGRCPRVRRFRCKERRYNTGSGLSFDSDVVCTRGSQRITSTFTEIF